MLPRSRIVNLPAPLSRRALATPYRTLSSTTPSRSTSSSSTTTDTTTSISTSSESTPPSAPDTFFKITLLRSAIGLGDAKKATLTSLGIHRRMQTVFHPHKPEFAGKILAVKELVRVENVKREEVRTKEEMRRMKRPPKGFEVVGRVGDGLDVNA